MANADGLEKQLETLLKRQLAGAPCFQLLEQFRWLRIDTDCTEERPD